jgi:hypothetical protein
MDSISPQPDRPYLKVLGLIVAAACLIAIGYALGRHPALFGRGEEAPPAIIVAAPPRPAPPPPAIHVTPDAVRKAFVISYEGHRVIAHGVKNGVKADGNDAVVLVRDWPRTLEQLHNKADLTVTMKSGTTVQTVSQAPRPAAPVAPVAPVGTAAPASSSTATPAPAGATLAAPVTPPTPASADTALPPDVTVPNPSPGVGYALHFLYRDGSYDRIMATFQVQPPGTQAAGHRPGRR